MKPQDRIHVILAEVSLLLQMYEMPAYAGGIVTKDYMIKDYVKRTISEIQAYNDLTLDQALEYKYNLEQCEKLMLDFPKALQELVVSPDFDLYWARLNPIGRNFIIYFHEDSYPILRQVKSSEELLTIDLESVIKDIKFSWSNKTRELFGLPEEFNEYPYNKLQLLKQKKVLKSLGFNLDAVDYAYISNNYTNFIFKILFKTLFEFQSFQDKLLMLESFEISLPWYTKQQINFIERGEAKFLSKVN